jgi:hypothetical protein
VKGKNAGGAVASCHLRIFLLSSSAQADDPVITARSVITGPRLRGDEIGLFGAPTNSTIRISNSPLSRRYDVTSQRSAARIFCRGAGCACLYRLRPVARGSPKGEGGSGFGAAAPAPGKSARGWSTERRDHQASRLTDLLAQTAQACLRRAAPNAHRRATVRRSTLRLFKSPAPCFRAGRRDACDAP